MINVLEYLENAAGRFPEKTAFADPDDAVTYAQLYERARRIGTALAAETEARTPVPVLLEKSVRAVEVFLGAVYAGCFYSMLDVRQPAARQERILKTLGARILVTDREHALRGKELMERRSGEEKDGETGKDECKEDTGKSGLREERPGKDRPGEEKNAEAGSGAGGGEKETDPAPGRILLYEELVNTPADEAALARIRAQAADTDPLYVNFTSGSTGVPKGVVVGHRSVLDFIDCFTQLFGIGSGDVIGNQAPLDFDVSVKDIYSTLKLGATMQIIPQKYFSIPTQLLDYLIGREVTVLIWAVSALTLLSRLHGFTYKIPEKVRLVIFSGEVMPVKQLNIWREALPEAVYVNVYGPTEITCNCTYYILDRAFDVSETIPMGKAFPNERVFLLDGEDRLVTEPGREGELCVAGTALALGYYNNPSATAAAFVQNPLNTRYPELIYRTGDLAKYLDDGNLCFCGRKDFQIKHMGHRIELGEIEQAINALPGIGSCCCLFLKEKITAFYSGEPDKKELAASLKSVIPDYMVPNRFVRMESLPLNKNGKIDRQALKEMG